MKIGKPADDRIIVTVKTCSRDTREQVKGKANPSFGKIVYETFESIDIFEATAEQVHKTIMDALTAKSK